MSSNSFTSLSSEHVTPPADRQTLSRIQHPMDRMETLLTMATRDNNITQKHLIETLLTIIDGLHARICNLEDQLADRPVARAE